MPLLTVHKRKSTYTLTLDGTQMAALMYAVGETSSGEVQEALSVPGWDVYTDLYEVLCAALNEHGLLHTDLKALARS